MSAEKDAKVAAFLSICKSKEHLGMWIDEYLGFNFPDNYIDPDSNSSPLDWLWEAYCIVRDNKGNETSEIVVLSSRESYKTLTESVLEVLCIVHFQLTVAHMAAIASQSAKSVSYNNMFIRRINQFLEAHGRKVISQNTKKISIVNKDGGESYIQVIIATMSGANSEHTNIFCVDGKQNILIKNNRDTSNYKAMGNKNRLRINKTARGVYSAFCRGEELEALSYNFETGDVEFKKIIKAYKSKKNILEIKTDKNTIKVSSEHPIFKYPDGYIEAGKLVPGDQILNIGRTKTATAALSTESADQTICKSIQRKQLHTSTVLEITKHPEQTVYDFTVEDNHNFFCNSVLVHNCVDEVDVIRFPQAYEESKLIPGVVDGRFPLTIYTSTRKFAFGLMQKEIDRLHKQTSGKVLQWNLLDITEKCPKERHLPDEPKELRYIHPSLPLRNLSKQEFESLHPDSRKDYEEINAYKGCGPCPLLPVCKTRLAHRPDKDKGGLWKPIDFTIGQFQKISPDMAEAQLLCRKPSSKGLIYGRFSETENTLTIRQAWEAFTGEKNDNPNLMVKDLIDLMHRHGVKFYAGVDWGFKHYFAIVISAIVPTTSNPKGEWWFFETFAAPDLEFDDQLQAAMSLRDKYRPVKWFADTAQPMFIKTFNKNGMSCKKFTKDIDGGIESVRGQIVDAKNRRRLKIIVNEPSSTIIKSPEAVSNQFLIDGFKNHHFTLDAQGEPTRKPDDEEYADVMDSVRYKGQNLFDTKTKVVIDSTPNPAEKPIVRDYSVEDSKSVAAQYLQDTIQKLSGGQTTDSSKKGNNSGILFDFGNLDPDE